MFTLTLKVVGTLLLAALGGLAFDALGIPVSWLSGGMVAVGIAGLFGVPVEMPAPLRSVLFFVVGVSMGSAITPESLAGVVAWPLSILAMGLTVVAVTAASWAILRLRGGWARRDALLASTPGALSLMIALSDTVGADVGRVALVQSLRVAFLTLTLPPLLRYLSPEDFVAEVVTLRGGLTLLDILLLVAAALVGVAVCRLVRLPAVALIGALLGSGTLHGAGIVESSLPPWVLIVMLVGIGAAAGTRFRDVDRATFRRAFADGVLTFTATLATALAASWLAARALSFSFSQTSLAFAPGGFDVMMVMAFALGVDPAYVAAHHVVRFVGISLIMPILMRRRRD